MREKNDPERKERKKERKGAAAGDAGGNNGRAVKTRAGSTSKECLEAPA